MRGFIYVTALCILIGYTLSASLPASRKLRVLGKRLKQDGVLLKQPQGLSVDEIRAKVKESGKKRQERPSQSNRKSGLGDDPDVS